MNIYNSLCKSTEKYLNNDAVIVVDNNQRVSYKRLLTLINDAAQILSNAGISQNCFVGICLPDGLGVIILTYAVWKLKGCVVPLSKNLTEEGIKSIKNTVHLDYLIIRDDQWQKFKKPFWYQNIASINSKSSLLNIKQTVKHPPQIIKMDVAFVRFSSGTTGKSKGVILSHASVLDRIKLAQKSFNLNDQDRILWLLSMSHHFTASILCFLSFGAAVILPAKGHKMAFPQIATKYHATIIMGLPIHYAFACGNAKAIPNTQTLNSVRIAISTGSRLNKDIIQAFYQRFNVWISQAYGIIEIGLPFINSRPTADNYLSVGNITEGYQLKLKPLEKMSSQNHNTLNMILVKGPGIFDGYYDPFKTRNEILQEGWFWTDDIGHLSDNNDLFLVGRKTDVIDIMGNKIFPTEIEDVLASHPYIAEARVYPFQSKSAGTLIQAEVVLINGINNISELLLKKFCSIYLEKAKVPFLIKIVAKINKTNSGKPIR